MDFLYQNYDTTIILACLGAVILALLILTVVYFVYYRGRDVGHQVEEEPE